MSLVQGLKFGSIRKEILRGLAREILEAIGACDCLGVENSVLAD